MKRTHAFAVLTAGVALSFIPALLTTIIYKEGDGLPDHARLGNVRNYGMPVNFGIKGSF